MDKQTKSIAIQWIGPTAIMIIILGIMLFNFSVKSRTSANDTAGNGWQTD